MISTTSTASQTNIAELSRGEAASDWQRLAAEAVTDPAELLDLLGIDAKYVAAARRAAESFALRVPRGFVNRMQRGDIRDPLLMQVLPIIDEIEPTEGFTKDPVGDLASRATPGVLHKYEGRALLIATGACAIHCRYCFRRHFPYSEETASQQRWRSALDYIRGEPSLNEVILSGGDPLNLSNQRLHELTDSLESIAHIKRLRIHTRTAVVLPERIDSKFCRWLAGVKLQKVVVLHVNHAREIDASVRAMCARLKECGAVVFNQSVLLAGVNDSVKSLSQLSETLFAAGVTPYYLSLLDRVQGAAHFEVSEAQAKELIRSLSAALPGYLVPKLVREVAGAEAKTSVSLSI